MSWPSKRLEAHCTSCDAVFIAEEPAARNVRIKSATRNRDVWMQTHCDVTGHPRFDVTDASTITRILSRNTDQMTINEEESYSTFKV